MTGAHYLSMVVMAVGSFLFGMLPKGFSLRVNRSTSLFLSLVLCLGAGVLLATSLVHMLTEVQTKLKLSAQLYFCGGFLLMYSVDEISHYCLGSTKPEIHSSVSREDSAITKNYEATESSNLLDSFDDKATSANVKNLLTTKYECQSGRRNGDEACSSSQQQEERCHLDIAEPCSSNPVTKTGLLMALLIHSIFEGISIGVQTEISQILVILGAVSFHKIVLSFCLGLELHSYGYKALSFFIAIFLFSIGSPIGILIGMSVASSSGIFNVDAQLQALAAGSLLYVAAFEVLPRERFKWQHKPGRKAAGIFQLLCLLLGFVCITVLHIFLAPEH